MNQNTVVALIFASYKKMFTIGGKGIIRLVCTEKASECKSKHLKSKNFLGEHAPGPPYRGWPYGGSVEETVGGVTSICFLCCMGVVVLYWAVCIV